MILFNSAVASAFARDHFNPSPTDSMSIFLMSGTPRTKLQLEAEITNILEYSVLDDIRTLTDTVTLSRTNVHTSTGLLDQTTEYRPATVNLINLPHKQDVYHEGIADWAILVFHPTTSLSANAYINIILALDLGDLGSGKDIEMFDRNVRFDMSSKISPFKLNFDFTAMET